MKKLQLEITTPERTVYKEEVDSVTIPTVEGEITVLPNHTALVGLVVPGALSVRTDGTERYVAVSGGALQVMLGSVCVILTDSAERAEELVEAEIEAARERAKAVLIDARNRDQMAYTDAAAHLERELARLKVVHKHRKGRGITPESA